MSFADVDVSKVYGQHSIPLVSIGLDLGVISDVRIVL
jgi:hypothetical protein